MTTPFFKIRSEQFEDYDPTEPPAGSEHRTEKEISKDENKFIPISFENLIKQLEDIVIEEAAAESEHRTEKEKFIDEKKNNSIAEAAEDASHHHPPPSRDYNHDPRYRHSPYDNLNKAKQEIDFNPTYCDLHKSRRDVEKTEKELRKEQWLNEEIYIKRERLRNVSMLPLQKVPDVVGNFPLDLFPVEAQRLISEFANSRQVPIEAVPPALLGAISATARGNYKVGVKIDVWEEALTEYFITIIPSGGKKSAIVKFFKEPIKEFESQRQDVFRKYDSALKVEIKALQKRKKDCEAEYMDILQQDSFDIDVEREVFTKIIQPIDQELQNVKNLPRIFSDISTPKALAEEMECQHGVTAVFEPEGGFLECSINASRADIVLKGFTWESFSYKTSTSGEIHISNPCLSICLYVQEDIAEQFFSDKALKSLGVSARFLPTFVNPLSGSRDPYPMDVSDEVKNWYSKKIHSLLEITCPKEKGTKRANHILECTQEAQKALQNYSQWNSDQLDRGYFAESKAFAEKLGGHAARLSGLLHLLKHAVPHEHQIDLTTMKGGIALAEFFKNHAIAAFDKESLQGFEYATKIIKWIDRVGQNVFRQRTAQKGIFGIKKYQIDPGLEVLEKNGYIRRIKDSTTVWCVVNPKYNYKYETLFDRSSSSSHRSGLDFGPLLDFDL